TVAQQATLRIENDGEGEWHRATARIAFEKARIGVFNNILISGPHQTGHGETREPEVGLHGLKTRSFFCETVGRRVWDKTKIGLTRVAKRETGLINAAGRHDHAIPIQERRRERQGADFFDIKTLRRRECADTRHRDAVRNAARNDIRAGDIKTGAAPCGSGDAAAPVIEYGKKKQRGEDRRSGNNDPNRELKFGSARERPRPNCKNSAKAPHFAGAVHCGLAALMHPGSELREQNQRGEDEVDDEKEIPCDAIFRERIEHARAKGREAVENDVAGDPSGVNHEEHVEGGTMEAVATSAFNVPPNESAREPRESRGKNRQADEGMREAAMVARNA